MTSGFTLADGGLVDDKEEGAFRTIGEVAGRFGIRQHVLRYWEEQFPMLRPLKRAGGRRYYRPEDVALVAEINRLLNDEGFTIRGARQALTGGLPASPGARRAATIKRTEPRQPAPAPQPAIAERLKDVRASLVSALEDSASTHG